LPPGCWRMPISPTNSARKWCGRCWSRRVGDNAWGRRGVQTSHSYECAYVRYVLPAGVARRVMRFVTPSSA
jgi:hypothetical protein